MKSSDIFVAVLACSLAAGLIVAFPPQLPDLSQDEPLQNSSDAAGNSSLEYGTAHAHALFYVVVNGTELDFSGKEYQLNSKFVHLEGNRSDIVHKHAQGVTWNRFLDTINVSINSTTGQVCLSRPGERYCGEGRVAVEDGKNLSAEIRQGDNLAVVIGGKVNQTIDEYLGKRLPPAFRESLRGFRV
ncbi:MAG: hypothetical protein ABEJ91_00525 [Candidatus Nanohaloarchaea archaeon]